MDTKLYEALKTLFREPEKITDKTKNTIKQANIKDIYEARVKFKQLRHCIKCREEKGICPIELGKSLLKFVNRTGTNNVDSEI